MKKIIFILIAFIAINTTFAQLPNTQDVKDIVTTIEKTSSKVKVPKVGSTLTSMKDSAISSITGAANTVATGAVNGTNYVDTSHLFRTMYSDLKSGVVALAQTFKTTAEKVLYIIGKKYFLMGIYAWVEVLIALILGIVIYRKTMKNWHLFGASGSDWSPAPLFGAIIVFGLIVFITITLQTAINYTFNPEYYVLEELVNIVKNYSK